MEQVEIIKGRRGHVVVAFSNGYLLCSCGLGKDCAPNLRGENNDS